MNRSASVVLLLCCSLSFAQYGIAPNNYFPTGYNGSTFSGVVSDSGSDQITLSYTHDGKTQVFLGRFESGCAVPNKDGKKMMPTDIPKGTTMTVYFEGRTRKIDDQKVQENLIIGISFDTWNGQKVNEDKKKIYFCSKDQYLHFKAWQR